MYTNDLSNSGLEPTLQTTSWLIHTLAIFNPSSNNTDAHPMDTPTCTYMCTPPTPKCILSIVHTYIHTYICTYIHTFIHTYTHIRTYIHTHIHEQTTYASSPSLPLTPVNDGLFGTVSVHQSNQLDGEDAVAATGRLVEQGAPHAAVVLAVLHQQLGILHTGHLHLLQTCRGRPCSGKEIGEVPKAMGLHYAYTVYTSPIRWKAAEAHTNAHMRARTHTHMYTGLQHIYVSPNSYSKATYSISSAGHMRVHL